MTAKQLPTLGEQVRAARKAAGLSQQALADRANTVAGHKFTQDTITRIERNIRRVDVDEYWTLEEVLGAHLSAWEAGSAAEELKNLLPQVQEAYDSLGARIARLEALFDRMARERGSDRG